MEAVKEMKSDTKVA